MIFTERKITVRNGKSCIDEPVILYRGDYEVSIKFTIMESKFRFKSGVNLIDSEKASHGQLAILAPYGGNVFSEIVICEGGTVTFTLTKEMIDQLEEVGLYSFQIRLFDYYRESRVSIPPVEFGIEVREPIASEDHDNTVNNAIVGYSIAKVADALNEDVPDTFDANGNYNKTDWETGDRITEGKLNKIEDALDKINQNEINDKNTLNKQMISNFNVLTSQLAHKMNKGDSISVSQINKNLGKLDQSYMNDEFLQQMAGTTPINSVPLDNSITTEKLADNSISHKKLDSNLGGMMRLNYASKNMFDKSLAMRNMFFWGGSIIDFTDRIFSGSVINVMSGSELTISIQNEDTSAVFDGVQFYKNGVYLRILGIYDTKTSTFKIPEDVDGFSFNIKTNVGHTEDDFLEIINNVQVEYGTSSTSVVACIPRMDIKKEHYEAYSDFLDIKNEFNEFNKAFINGSKTYNLFDKSLALDKYIYNDDGTLRPFDKGLLTGIIPVYPKDTYTVSIQDTGNGLTSHFYNMQFWKDDELISKTNVIVDKTELTFSVPKECNGVSFDVMVPNLDYEYVKNSIQLEIGNVKNKYINYEAEKKIRYSKYEIYEQIMKKGKYYNKNIWTFGDSITAGMAEGSWVGYTEKILECNLTNKAVSGHSSMSMVAIMTDIQRWGGDLTPSIDYSVIDAITIQIGTNDFMRGEISSIPYGFGKQLKDMPFEYNGVEISTYEEYFANFPNNYFGHVGASIEWVKWKNPKCKIYLITEPHNMSEYDDGNGGWKYIYEVRDYMMQLGKFYSIPVIDAVYEAGLTDRNFADYSYDLCHLNDRGNKIWGEYIAYQMLSR